MLHLECSLSHSSAAYWRQSVRTRAGRLKNGLLREWAIHTCETATEMDADRPAWREPRLEAE